MYAGGVLAANRLRGGGAPASSSLVHTDHGESASNTLTHTFSTRSLGTAASDRRIVVFAGGRGGAAATATCTVQGISATQEANVHWTTSGDTQLIMFVVDVPTGTTGDVVVTWSFTCDRCGIEVYALYGTASGTPDVVSTRDTAGTFGSFTLASASHVAGGAFTIAATNRTARISGASDDLSAGSPTISFTAAETDVGWTGLTEDHDATVEVIGGTGFLGAPAIIAAWESV